MTVYTHGKWKMYQFVISIIDFERKAIDAISPRICVSILFKYVYTEHMYTRLFSNDISFISIVLEFREPSLFYYRVTNGMIEVWVSRSTWARIFSGKIHRLPHQSKRKTAKWGFVWVRELRWSDLHVTTKLSW